MRPLGERRSVELPCDALGGQTRCEKFILLLFAFSRIAPAGVGRQMAIATESKRSPHGERRLWYKRAGAWRACSARTELRSCAMFVSV